MAKARMLHNKISTSMQVNSLSLPAKLLFTWIISHVDDQGRLLGEPVYIKAIIVPMTNWPVKKIKSYLEDMREIGLIHYWQQNTQWFIELINWDRYQTIRKKLYKDSVLPKYSDKNVDPSTTQVQPERDPFPTQYNIDKSSPIKVSKSEYKKPKNKKSLESIKKIIRQKHFPSPKNFIVKNASENAAKETWMFLEPNNPKAFYSTYLKAARNGLPFSYFYTFKSEIKQSNARNPGAVFNSKVKAYFKRRSSSKN